MKLSDIAGLLSGGTAPADFRSTNAADFAERRGLLGRRGSAIPVRVVEDKDIEISQRDIATLCRHFIGGGIDAVELAYLADAVQLADRVTWTDELAAEYVVESTDPEVNGPFTAERAKQIIRDIEQHT